MSTPPTVSDFGFVSPIGATACAVPRPETCHGLPLPRGRTRLARPGLFSQLACLRVILSSLPRLCTTTLLEGAPNRRRHAHIV